MQTRQDRRSPTDRALFSAALFFGVVAVAGMVPMFSVAVRLWITVGADVLMVALLVAWALVGRRADNLRRTRI